MVNTHEHVTTDVQAHILTITLQRPERKNALTLVMYTALSEAINKANNDPTIRVVLLQGSEGSFSSGNDLEDFLKHREKLKHDNAIEAFMHSLLHCTKPVVAAVTGPAVGIGFTLLLHCDLVYVSENARLKLPFASLGLCPEFASSYVLPRILGHVRAAELLLLGETLDGKRAETLGLANRCVPEDELTDIAQQACQRLANQPPAAIRTTKQLMRDSQKNPIATTMGREFPLFFQALQGGEFNEACQAFFEKRAPDFSHFE